MLPQLQKTIDSAHHTLSLLETVILEVASTEAKGRFTELHPKPISSDERLVTVITSPSLKALITVVGRRLTAIPSLAELARLSGEKRKNAAQAIMDGELLKSALWEELRAAYGMEGSSIGLRAGWRLVELPGSPMVIQVGMGMAHLPDGIPSSLADLIADIFAPNCGDPDCPMHGTHAQA